MTSTRMNSLVSEDGQNIVEYTLMIGLVVLVIWVGISVFNIPYRLQQSGAMLTPK